MATKKILADLHVDGNVGIGTTTLQNSSGYKTLSINGSTGGQIAFQTSGAGRHYIFGSATDFNIYNSTAGNLILHTNAAERMRIDANGNVGIGTDNPNRTFQVAGSFAITDSSDTSSILIIPSTSVNNIYSRQSQGVNSSTPLAVTMGTSEVFRIETDGNVGIGTDTPGAKLTVAGDVLIDSGEYLSWGAAGATSIEGSTASNKLQFRTSSTDRMIINDTGVGIGTTSPGEKLTVHSTATAISSFYTTNSAGGFTSYQNSTGGVKGFVGYGPTLFTGLDINNFGLRSQSGMPFATGGGNVRMYINSSGNVGIGTTSPGYKLDVESSTTPLHLNRTGGATALIGLDIAGVNRGFNWGNNNCCFCIL